MRPSLRQTNEMRKVNFTLNFTKHAEGSVLVEFGDTKVICNASIEYKVPSFLKGKSQGWVTAEYGMLPRSTDTRMRRESSTGKQGGRTLEIQRLIARALRVAVDLTKLDGITITVDCDVIQADGGTRTAAITGGFVAMSMAINSLHKNGKLKNNPIVSYIGAISVGIYNNIPVLDLDYAEDSQADTDMNVVMDEAGRFIEVQGTAETAAFTKEQMNSMLSLAQKGIQQLIAQQRLALSGY